MKYDFVTHHILKLFEDEIFRKLKKIFREYLKIAVHYLETFLNNITKFCANSTKASLLKRLKGDQNRFFINITLEFTFSAKTVLIILKGR